MTGRSLRRWRQDESGGVTVELVLLTPLLLLMLLFVVALGRTVSARLDVDGAAAQAARAASIARDPTTATAVAGGFLRPRRRPDRWGSATAHYLRPSSHR